MAKKYSDKQKAEYYKKQLQKEKSMRRNRPSKSYNRNNYQNQIGYNLGSTVGSYIAPGIGQRIGGAVGSAIQQGATSLISGHGDYLVKRNSLLYNSDAVPKFSNDKRCTIISHREFIKDIRSSVDFESTEFLINPGDFQTFPWLSRIAQNYEEYIFQGIVVEYKTNSATAVSSTNTALGTVCMASQYNTLAPSFTSKHQIENYEFANSAVPCESFLHAIECDPAMGNEVKSIYNERDSDINADPRNYNLCRTTIATQGMQAASTIGELWVSYKVCLMKPRLGNNDNVADWFSMDVAEISATEPLTQALIPSTQNIGIVSQILSGNYNTLEIDPIFQGVLRIEVTYALSAYTSFVPPQISIVSGNMTNVTSKYKAADSSVRPFLSSGQDPVPCATTSVAYFKVAGGYDSSGGKPIFSVNAMTEAGCTFTAANLSVMAVPSQAIQPEYL